MADITSGAPLDVATVLERAADLISKPKSWTRMMMSRNARGAYVPPKDPSATCWCAMGAIEKIADNWTPARSALLDFLGVEMIGPWNDGSSHAEVVQALRDAAAKARGAAS